jgi:hypothetical protein
VPEQPRRADGEDDDVGLNIFVFLLLAGVAYANLNEGIYGALIVLLLSLVSGVIALNFFGPIATFMIVRHLPWAGFGRYTEGIIFLLLYGGSLLGLRSLFDHMLTERVRFPVNVDRVGGVAIGLLTGIITVGAFIVACQMMPLNKQFMGYRKKQAILGIAPDATYLNVMRHLSARVLETSSDPAVHMPKPIDIRDYYYNRRDGRPED